ncbi:MAG TPA: hypothetical protein VMB25_15165 [Bryobacteraceae bacterium]|nr:hypothetical protein [Bryobacteraceae bacterium]
MSKVLASKMLLAMFALLVCAGMLQAQLATPLTATPSSITINYVVGTGSTAVPMVFKSAASGGTTFYLDTTSMPAWLTADNTTGLATATGFTVNFNASASGLAGLAAGSYSATVNVLATGYTSLPVYITLVLSDPTSTVSVSDSSGVLTTNTADTATKSINWTPGTAIPTETLTISSNNSPISYTVGAVTNPVSNPNWVSTNVTSGIAYNFGSSVTVSFLASALNNAVAGLSAGAVTLTSVVTITPASGNTQTITINISIQEPPVVVSSMFPTQTPVHASGSLTVVLAGNYFGTTGAYTANPTTVMITYGSHGPTNLNTITGGSVTVANPSSLVLVIPYEDSTPNSILDTAGQNVTITIQNGTLGTAVSETLTVTNSPIIYTLTDAASLVDVGPTGTPTVAPYELISIFGDNFGPTSGTPVVAGLSAYSQYPNTLTANAHPLTVAFNTGSGTLIQQARLLFATNNQINLMVPSAVLGNTQVQVVVTYDGISSTAFIANVAAANPGVFTTGASGQGQGAILLSNYTVNSDATAANKAAPGGVVLIYLSGMGTPDSTSQNVASTKAASWPTSCIAATGTDSYFSTVNTNLTAGWVMPTTPGTVSDDGIDGAVILGGQITSGHYQPCFATAKVAVTIGGAAATVSYAGWVSGSVDGLYQVNAAVPSKATAGDLPVVVTITIAGKTYTSQPGVTVAVN